MEKQRQQQLHQSHQGYGFAVQSSVTAIAAVSNALRLHRT
jgi:hypothetical protein